MASAPYDDRCDEFLPRRGGGDMSIQPAALLAELSAAHAVSGSELAQRLGVTRAAVWKQVEALRALGAPIEAAAGRGYRLTWPIQMLDAASIRAELDAPTRKRLGDLQVYWQTASTSDVLLQRAPNEAEAGGDRMPLLRAGGITLDNATSGKNHKSFGRIPSPRSRHWRGE